ncbi:MAG: hypothetical protein KGS47_13930 [Chloroflexi bacterium]|nr:hypothetical protein [Chloroflexota bacterium]
MVHTSEWRLDGKRREKRAYSTYQNCPLLTAEDRLEWGSSDLAQILVSLGATLTPAFSSLALRAFMNTSDHDLVSEFFEPLLQRAVRYDRGVGFFSSSWLRINARGMLAFAAAGGRARWVTSPILDAADWEALQLGDAARDDIVLRQALEWRAALTLQPGHAEYPAGWRLLWLRPVVDWAWH